jgi:hypothetical protein
MKPWMFALVFGRRPQLVTVPFTSNGTLAVPPSISAVNISGNGAPGSPATPGVAGYTLKTDTILYRKDGGTETFSDTQEGTGSPPGPSMCDPYEPISGSDTYNGQIVCRTYTSKTTGGSPATTGAAASGLGKTFPGGVGVTATPASYSNVAVTPGSNPPITVPAGASITITYYI